MVLFPWLLRRQVFATDLTLKSSTDVFSWGLLGGVAVFQLSATFQFKKKKKSKLSSPVLPGIHFLLEGPSPGLCNSVNIASPLLAAGS